MSHDHVWAWQMPTLVNLVNLLKTEVMCTPILECTGYLVEQKTIAAKMGLKWSSCAL